MRKNEWGHVKVSKINENCICSIRCHSMNTSHRVYATFKIIRPVIMGPERIIIFSCGNIYWEPRAREDGGERELPILQRFPSWSRLCIINGLLNYLSDRVETRPLCTKVSHIPAQRCTQEFKDHEGFGVKNVGVRSMTSQNGSHCLINTFWYIVIIRIPCTHKIVQWALWWIICIVYNSILIRFVLWELERTDYC